VVGSRCAFSARKRSEARRPACVLPRMNPQPREEKAARSMRLSKDMPSRSGEVRRAGCGFIVGSVGGGECEESEGSGADTVAIIGSFEDAR